jgi:hypothetical protein
MILALSMVAGSDFLRNAHLWSVWLYALAPLRDAFLLRKFVRNPGDRVASELSIEVDEQAPSLVRQRKSSHAFSFSFAAP